MMFKHVSTILRTCALAGLIVGFSYTDASALPIVNFDTTGDFGGGGSSITFGGANSATLTFATGGAAGLNAPSNANFGAIEMTTTGTGFSGVASTAFTLGISQTLPLPGGTSSIGGTIAGTFAQINATDFTLTFPISSTSIDGVTYSVQPFYFLTFPTSGAGVTTLQGFVTAQAEPPTAVPEPATMMLLGTGLLAAFRARRRTA